MKKVYGTDPRTGSPITEDCPCFGYGKICEKVKERRYHHGWCDEHISTGDPRLWEPSGNTSPPLPGDSYSRLGY